MDDDDGMMWWAQVGQWEQEQREQAWQEAKRLNRLLDEHRQWVREFNAQETAHEMD